MIADSVMAALAKWRVLDSLAAFCISTSPSPSIDFWIGNLGGDISRFESVHAEKGLTVRVGKTSASGFITNIVTDSSDHEVMYCGGVMAQGLYRSLDGGHSWHRWRSIPNSLFWLAGKSLSMSSAGGDKTLTTGVLNGGSIHRFTFSDSTWSVVNNTLMGAVCSLHQSSVNSSLCVLGSRGGVISLLDQSGTLPAKIVMSTRDYTEIPEIIEVPGHPGHLLAAITSFDSTGQASGVWESCDDGETWTHAYSKGVSLWAIEPIDDQGTIVVGGFSEAEWTEGIGHITVVDLHTGDSIELGNRLPWINDLPGSIWDIESTHCEYGYLHVVVATTNGTYVSEH